MNVHLSLRLSLFSVAIITTLMGACTKADHDLCDPPNATLEWFFIEETGAPWIGTLTKCILCDFSVESTDIPDWIAVNAGEDFLSTANSLNGYLPCLYVYEGASESFDTCEAAVCGGNAVVNDAVSSQHGAANVITSYDDLVSMDAGFPDAESSLALEAPFGKGLTRDPDQP